MENNLAAEIARIEAELEADRQNRERQQQQQPQNMAVQNTIPTFGVSPVPQQAPQQQQMPFAQLLPQQQMGAVIGQADGIISQGAAQPHHFTKDSDSRSIFVGNIPKGENGGPTTTQEELVHFFSDCGPILNCTLLRDRTSGELKGTAYIEFSTYTGMGKAIDTKNNTIFKGSTIIVTKKRSTFRPERARGRGGAGGAGRGGMPVGDPLQAMMALMGMVAGGAMARGGRSGGGRSTRGGGAHRPVGGFQPFQ